MVTIAVDAMGGDHAPKMEVEGAVRASRSLGVQVVLVGRKKSCERSWPNTTAGNICRSSLSTPAKS
jgi:glycerol-3-phosphate acyltransferase PlsX